MQPGSPMLAFLCGGMEYSPDGGRQWRERMRLWIQETLNHRVYDPADEARRLLTEEELRNLTEWKRTAVERFRKRSEEHTSELQSLAYLVCRLLLEKKKKRKTHTLDHMIVRPKSSPVRRLALYR